MSTKRKWSDANNREFFNNNVEDLDETKRRRHEREKQQTRCSHHRNRHCEVYTKDPPQTQEKQRSESSRNDRRSDTAHEIEKHYADYHDQEGHYKYSLGDSIGEVLSTREPDRRRYKLIAKVGQGTFGRVFTCWDRVKQGYVAVKIVRAVRKYTQSARFEIDILTKLQNYAVIDLTQVEDLDETSQVKRQPHTEIYPNDPRPDTKVRQHCIKLLSWFSYKGHICMVFDHCGLSLYDFLKKNEYRPFEMNVIRDVAYYLLQSLHFMHDAVHLVHTDLKPENVLFRDSEIRFKDFPDYLEKEKPRTKQKSSTSSGENGGGGGGGRDSSSVSRSRSRSVSLSRSERASISSSRYRVPGSTKIKVIDLGSAIFENDHHSSVISTRHYRAPEVILRLGWSYPSDIWSIGCILLELYTGDTTFQTHHNAEHLAMMEAILGPFPQHLITTRTPTEPTAENLTSSEKLNSVPTTTTTIPRQGEKEDENREDLPPPPPQFEIAAKNSVIQKYFRKKTSEDQFCVDFPQRSTSSRSRRRVAELRKLDEIIDTMEHGDFYFLVKKMLVYDPDLRITAVEALELPFFKGMKE